MVLLLLASGSLHAAPRADGDPVRLRVGTLAIAGSRYMTDMAALADEIARRTRGGVELAWVADGQLGEEVDMVRLVRKRELDGGALSETGLVALVPEMAAWGAPGRFHTYEDVDRAIADADAGLRARFAKTNLELVMWADLGFARVFSRDPLGDLTSVLERSRDVLRAPIDGASNKRIADGSVRTWALPPLYMLAVGNHARYMSNLRYRYVIGALVLSRAAWARMTPAQQATVREVCAAWEAKLRVRWRKETERAIAALGKAGVATQAASEAEVAAFVEHAQAER